MMRSARLLRKLCCGRAVLALAAVGTMTAGCGALPSWMGGGAKGEPKLPGARARVLPATPELKPDASLEALEVTVPVAFQNDAWPQHANNVAASDGNLSFKGKAQLVASARVGEGADWSSMLVPPPVVAEKKVFAMDAAGNVSAHDIGDISRVLWVSKALAGERGNETFGGGLAYAQDKLYATSGRGAIMAFDPKTGKTLWRQDITAPFRSAPRVAGGRLFALTLDNQLFALAARNGEVLWGQRGISEQAEIMLSVSPVVKDDWVIAPFSSGEIHVFSAAQGREMWADSLALTRRNSASAVFSGIGGDPVVDGDVVFAVSNAGLLSVFHIASGQRVWEQPISSLNTPWVAGDFLYVLTADNALMCLHKYDGRIKWSSQLESFENVTERSGPLTWRGPVMAGGKLYVAGAHGRLIAVSPKDGSILETVPIPGGVYTSPVVAGGTIFLVGRDATLYALK